MSKYYIKSKDENRWVSDITVLDSVMSSHPKKISISIGDKGGAFGFSAESVAFFFMHFNVSAYESTTVKP
jgi:hypothetical protein